MFEDVNFEQFIELTAKVIENMTGRQILDAMYILKASRSVLAKHVALRRRQVDVFNKTSSLAKAVKTQTSRFPFISRAVSNIADQVKNSQSSGLSSPTGPQSPLKHGPQTTKSEKLEGKHIPSTKTLSGRESAHFDTSSGANPTIDHIPEEESGTRLENAQRSSVADESALPAKDAKPSPNRGRDTFSNRSFAESQHESLVDTDGKSEESLQPSSTNRTSIPTPSIHGNSMEPDRARKLQRLAERQVPSVSAEAHSPSEGQTPTSNHTQGELDTMKQQDTFFTRPVHTSPVLSSLPRVKLPTNTTSTQDGIEKLSDTDINQDVFYSAKPGGSSPPDAQALPEEGQPSNAMYSEIFHSPRVAKLLQREDKEGGPQDLHLKKGNLPRETNEESVSNVPPTGPKTVNSREEKNGANARQLADDAVRESPFASSTASKVSLKLHFARNHVLIN